MAGHWLDHRQLKLQRLQICTAHLEHSVQPKDVLMVDCSVQAPLSHSLQHAFELLIDEMLALTGGDSSAAM